MKRRAASTIAIAARHGAVAIGTATVTIRANDDGAEPEDATPAVAITSTADFPTNARFTVSLAFSESVTGLALEDIQVTNGAAANLEGSGTTYTAAITPRADFEGNVTVTVPAGAATDADGNGNAAQSAAFAVDTRAPTVQDTTLNQPLEEWTAPVDSGAPTATGVVRYPDGGGAGGSGNLTAAARAAGAEGTREPPTLTLSWDEPLDEASTPPAGAFTVRVAGAARAVAAVTVDGSTVRLVLAAPVASGRAVTVSYTAPAGAAATPIRDLAGNAAGDLTSAAVSAGATDEARAAPLCPG